jgi:hypothetical protein
MSILFRHRHEDYYQPRAMHLFALVASLLLALFIVLMLAVSTVR